MKNRGNKRYKCTVEVKSSSFTETGKERRRESVGKGWRASRKQQNEDKVTVAPASSKSFQRVIGVLSRPEMRHINFRQCPPESPG